MKDFKNAEKLINKKSMPHEYAELLLAQEKYDELKDYLNKNNITPQYKYMLELYLNTDLEAFVKYYNSLSLVQKKNINVCILQAKYLNKKGEYQKAVELLLPLEDKNWYNVELLNTIQHSYKKLNNTNKIKEYTTKITKIKEAFKCYFS